MGASLGKRQLWDRTGGAGGVWKALDNRTSPRDVGMSPEGWSRSGHGRKGCGQDVNGAGRC